MSRSVTLAVLGLVLFSGPAAAGMFRFPEGPAIPALLDGMDVQLVSAEVDAVLERGPFPPATVPFEGHRDRVRLDAVLVIRNRTSDPRVIRMGFPLGSEYTGPDDPNETDAGTLAARFDLLVREADRTYHVRFRPGTWDNGWNAALTWELSFAPGETREIRLHARVPVELDWDHSATELPAPPVVADLGEVRVRRTGLDLSTAGSWAGPVERLRVRFRVEPYEGLVRERGWPDGGLYDPPLPETLVHADHSPPGFRREDGVLSWSFDGDLPEEGIRVAWRITRLPRTPEGIPELVSILLGDDPAREDLDSIREVLLANNGSAPDVIAALDRVRKTARRRGEITAASLPGPGVTLPVADMAEVPKGLRQMLILPVPKMFFRPALRIEGNEAATIRRFEEMTDRIRAYADRDRAEEDPQVSNLDLLILADAGTSLSKILRTYMCGTAPDVRVWRYWFGARDGARRLAAIPAFLDIEDFGRIEPPSAHRADLRLESRRGPGAFRGAGALHRWCHAQRAAHPEGAIEIRLRADGDVAYERLVEILNEARRFGFRIAIVFGADALEGDPPHCGNPGWFHAPDAADLPAGPAPPRVPGKALAQEPFVLSQWLVE